MTRFASLHSGLLARKGEALPAGPNRLAAAYYAPEPGQDGPSPIEQADTQPPPIDNTRTAEADRAPATEDKTANRPQRLRRSKAQSTPARRKTTVRLSADQHRRLRVAAAQLDISQQSLMTQALEAYLKQLSEGLFPDCSCMSPKED